ncbi:hypothetical protein K461DRAFT_323538 [Myriangium duriaei CBS 260.36]|uniref:BTB domain-containing protein n=1 Tax=Myriangium duriaei CBS 260.36 TaxID=1168546 RepID=A0A9P4IU67_9PEZI|nr:hypothetical protein K461DRAFT_323538 [Myriangium duriaei CBS 260.36]
MAQTDSTAVSDSDSLIVMWPTGDAIVTSSCTALPKKSFLVSATSISRFSSVLHNLFYHAVTYGLSQPEDGLPEVMLPEHPEVVLRLLCAAHLQPISSLAPMEAASLYALAKAADKYDCGDCVGEDIHLGNLSLHSYDLSELAKLMFIAMTFRKASEFRQITQYLALEFDRVAVWRAGHEINGLPFSVMRSLLDPVDQGTLTIRRKLLDPMQLVLNCHACCMTNGYDVWIRLGLAQSGFTAGEFFRKKPVAGMIAMSLENLDRASGQPLPDETSALSADSFVQSPVSEPDNNGLSLTIMDQDGDAFISSAQPPIMHFLISSKKLSKFSACFGDILKDPTMTGGLQPSVSQPPVIERPEDGETLHDLFWVAHAGPDGWVPSLIFDVETTWRLACATATYGCEQQMARMVSLENPAVAYQEAGLAGVAMLLNAARCLDDPKAFRNCTRYMVLDLPPGSIWQIGHVKPRHDLHAHYIRDLVSQQENARRQIFQRFVQPMDTIVKCGKCKVARGSTEWYWIVGNEQSFTINDYLDRLIRFLCRFEADGVQLCTHHTEDKQIPDSFKSLNQAKASLMGAIYKVTDLCPGLCHYCVIMGLASTDRCTEGYCRRKNAWDSLAKEAQAEQRSLVKDAGKS